MRLLLDTHIWLWYLQGNDRLSNNLQQIINSSDTELWFSPISVWKAIVLAERGRTKSNNMISGYRSLLKRFSIIGNDIKPRIYQFHRYGISKC